MTEKPDSAGTAKLSPWPLRLGFGCSLLWIAAAVWVGSSTENPNEWGDFIGGFAGGLALIWVVIATHQSAQALRLQQRELHLQVQEMIKLVRAAEAEAEASRENIDLQNKRFREEQWAREAVLTPTSCQLVTKTALSCDLMNTGGGTCLFLEQTLQSPQHGKLDNKLTKCAPNESLSLRIKSKTAHVVRSARVQFQIRTAETGRCYNCILEFDLDRKCMVLANKEIPELRVEPID